MFLRLVTSVLKCSPVFLHACTVCVCVCTCACVCVRVSTRVVTWLYAVVFTGTQANLAVSRQPPWLAWRAGVDDCKPLAEPDWRNAGIDSCFSVTTVIRLRLDPDSRFFDETRDKWHCRLKWHPSFNYQRPSFFSHHFPVVEHCCRTSHRHCQSVFSENT